MRWVLSITAVLLVVVLALVAPLLSVGLSAQDEPILTPRSGGGKASATVNKLMKRYPPEALKSGKISEVELSAGDVEQLLRFAAEKVTRQKQIGSSVKVVDGQLQVAMAVPMPEGKFSNVQAHLVPDGNGGVTTSFLQVGDQVWPAWMADIYIQQGLQQLTAKSGLSLQGARLEGDQVHLTVNP